MDCVFCKIRDGQIPSAKIHEDERTFAIMDINPINTGHCLVIVKSHAPTVWDADPVDLHQLLDSVLRMAFNEIRHRARIAKDFGAVPKVEANESRLAQVFLNLVMNGAQAIAEFIRSATTAPC